MLLLKIQRLKSEVNVATLFDLEWLKLDDFHH